MQLSPEIFTLRTVSDLVMIGPRAAFGRGHRHAAQSEDAVRQRLNQARADPGALDRLRRNFERWRLGESFSYLTDRALIDRIAADTRRGRLACFLVPNGDVRYTRLPDATGVAIRLDGYAPRGTSTRIATAGRVISARAGAPAPVGGPAIGRGPRAAIVDRPDLPLDVGAMRIEQRLVEILHRTTESKRLGDETVTQLKALIDPAQIPQTVAVLTVWAASHAVGIGFAFDAVMLGVGMIVMGRAVLDGARSLNKFLEIATGAKTEAELDLAADLLASVIVTLGIRVLQAAIKRGATRVRSGAAKPESGFGRVDEAKTKTAPLSKRKEPQLLLGPGKSEGRKLLPAGKSETQKLLPAGRSEGQKLLPAGRDQSSSSTPSKAPAPTAESATNAGSSSPAKPATLQGAPINGATRTVPHGFSSEEQFTQASRELHDALKADGIDDALIGVRGSAVTGRSAFKGTEFGPESDIDFYVESEKLTEAYSTSKKIPGFVNPDKILPDYPALRAWSERWSEALGREITPGAFKPGTLPSEPAIVVK